MLIEQSAVLPHHSSHHRRQSLFSLSAVPTVVLLGLRVMHSVYTQKPHCKLLLLPGTLGSSVNGTTVRIRTEHQTLIGPSDSQHTMATSSCQQCAKMLKHVLAQESSRPMTILEAIGGNRSQGEEEATAVQMRIPIATATTSRHWNQLRRPSASSKLRTDRLLASSSSATAALATSARDTGPNVNDDTAFESLKIECRPCSSTGPESGARAFVMGPYPLSIVLCSNRLSYHDSTEMEQVLVHELVHVYDVRVHRLDLRSCENLAYSEVRAARDAECKDAWLAGRYCVPNKAYMATSNLFPPEEAKACMARVFDDAMADTEPLQKKNSKRVVGDEAMATNKPPSSER